MAMTVQDLINRLEKIKGRYDAADVEVLVEADSRCLDSPEIGLQRHPDSWHVWIVKITAR
jgi:hypothetical protein